MARVIASALLCSIVVACASGPAVSPRPPPPMLPPPASPSPAVLTRATGAQDTSLAMPKVLRQLNAARTQQGAEPLWIDRGLALMAQQASASYQRLGRGLEKRVADDAYRELAAFSLTFSDVRAIVVCVDRLEQAVDAMQPALDPAMRYAGLAVSPAPASDRGYAIVLTLGR